MRPALALALALFAAAAPAAAAPRLHGIPAHVRGGEDVRITWSGLGSEAHEAELELSLSGGRWVRISPELDAREGGFTWHVPAGLAGPARLRLRYGGEWFEAEGDVSTPFVIDADPGVAANRASDLALDEWWNLDRHSGALPFQQMSGAVSLHRTALAPALSPEPDRMARVVDSPTGRTPVRQDIGSRRDAVPHRGGLPRTFPLRI